MYHTHSHNFTIVALAQFMYYSPDLDGVGDISVPHTLTQLYYCCTCTIYVLLTRSGRGGGY